MLRFNPRFVKGVGYAFVPTLFRTQLINTEILPSSRQRSTSYLDGARGFAAVAVLNYHFFYAFSDCAEKPWNLLNPTLMPIIRVWVSGGSAIPLFFIFGGYAIASKPLSLMNSSTQATDLLATLSSSALRRFFRLYLPMFSITLLVAVLVQLGAYEHTRSRLGPSSPDLARMHEKHLERSPSFTHQIIRWQNDVLRATGVWDWNNYGPDHDKHLWTVLAEFRCSLAVYMTLLATARLKSWVRLATVLSLSVHSMYWRRHDVVDFYWGVALAQIDVMLASAHARRGLIEDVAPCPRLDLENTGSSHLSPRTINAARVIVLSALFLLSLWCISAPLWEWNTAFGYQTLASFVPPQYGARDKFVPAMGVIMLQRSLYMSSPSSFRVFLFTNRIALYLAKISFSLYLVHGPVLHAIGYNIPCWLWDITGKQTQIGYGAGLVGGWLISLAICLWAADVFNREVEARCVKITGWVETQCLSRTVD